MPKPGQKFIGVNLPERLVKALKITAMYSEKSLNKLVLEILLKWEKENIQH